MQSSLGNAAKPLNSKIATINLLPPVKLLVNLYLPSISCFMHLWNFILDTRHTLLATHLAAPRQRHQRRRRWRCRSGAEGSDRGNGAQRRLASATPFPAAGRRAADRQIPPPAADTQTLAELQPRKQLHSCGHNNTNTDTDKQFNDAAADTDTDPATDTQIPIQKHRHRYSCRH